MANYLVTGGCGFIGSNFIHQELAKGHHIVNLDVLSYAANQDNLNDCLHNPRYSFVQGDIGDQALVTSLLRRYDIDAVINFAAESHVDNSIAGPEIFIRTNVLGTYNILWASLQYWQERGRPADFRFLHVSTDEVYGDLPLDTPDKFCETSPYKPSSPYSASKAASDHLAAAWHRTYGLPVIVTNCSNNFGPYQHHEKLIPNMVRCALSGEAMPVYGQGLNVRDWIHVSDHCSGLALALTRGTPGETYCFGGNAERRNIDLVHKICDVLDTLRPKAGRASYRDQISFVDDRLGHDLRYAIDDSKARSLLGYQTEVPFETHFEDTVQWYLDHEERLGLRRARGNASEVRIAASGSTE